MRIVLLGPPGSGKGTQGKLLSRKYKVPLISTGDILREAARIKTELGIEAKKYFDKGELVPDSVMLGIIRDRVSKEDAKNGFILDGFPRTEVQARELEELLAKLGTPIDTVLNVVVTEPVIVKRLSSRVSCPNCGESFNTSTNPAKVPDVCDGCAGQLEKRVDDAEETVVKRIRVYQSSTEPLLNFYRERSLLHKVDGEGSVRVVFERIGKCLAGGGPAGPGGQAET